MNVEEGPRLERLAAQITNVGSLAGMGAHMYGHLGGGGKALIALLAGVREVVSVAAYMYGQIARHLKALAAQRANKGLCPVMASAVNLVLVAGLNQLCADITAKGAQIRFEKLTKLRM